VLLSNELVDAFPVHRLRWRQGGLEEAHVDLSDTGFTEAWLPATPEALRAAQELGGQVPGGPAGVLPEGRPFELCPEAREWLGECVRVLRRGYVLTLDYGAEAPELHSDRFPRGTLLAYRGHGTADPYQAPGDQDLSAWVDFSALAEEGRRQGLWSAPLTTQRDLLLHLGWPPQGAEESAGVPGALESLVAPGGLGSIRALLQGKGVSPVELLDT
jgi:SAM-dependent MidA family methyltransferase